MQRILVPTDASPLSEAAMPLAREVASAQQAEVFLVQIVSPPVWVAMDDSGYGSVSPDLYQQFLDSMEEEAQRNLDRLADFFGAGREPGTVHTQLFQGSPAAALLDYEAEIQPDLVVMATHGRTGLARFARGSVADRMVREGTAPVLMVRSFGRQVTALKRALVPLDGSELAEAALPVVEELACRPLNSIVLLTVIDAASAESADAYLEKVGTRLERTGVAVERRRVDGVPGEAIAEAAKDVDLVIMATHGRGGLDRLRYGSVAEHTLRETEASLLLVRAGVR
ncbi:MAG TPA: universal stress protein [Chloroflexota bacterium]|nr:universal stress protein [Chloroflexota bacterium]